MNSIGVKEIRSIAKTMSDFGISKLKLGDLELEIGRDSLTAKASEALQTPLDAGSNPAPAALPVDAPTEDSDPIKHKVEELANLMKLTDMELVDQLFPDQTEPDESEEVA